MAAYSFNAVSLKALYGHTFTVPDNRSGTTAEFRIPPREQARARTGMEAIGLFVDCIHPLRGRTKSFLKIFKHDIPARRNRTAFMVNTTLVGRHPWIFHGVPYLWLDEYKVNGTPIIGHAAFQIGGMFGAPAEDFGRLRTQNSWDRIYSESQRFGFAAHLCVAVVGLERMEIVHGDISPGNVMIGPGPNGLGDPVCTLCDYDGMYHKNLQPLPRKINGFDCRPLGSPGFQYPELLERIARDTDSTDERIMVLTDRFALGVMCCELVTWSQNTERLLNRGTMLRDQDIRNRSLRDLPAKLLAEWPRGFDLLRAALQASRIEDMPGPKDWLAALGMTISREKPFRGRPKLDILRSSGNRDTLMRTVQLDHDMGDFGPVHPNLKSIGFSVKSNILTLTVEWPHPVFLVTGGRPSECGTGPVSVAVGPGDVLVSNGWKISAQPTT